MDYNGSAKKRLELLGAKGDSKQLQGLVFSKKKYEEDNFYWSQK